MGKFYKRPSRIRKVILILEFCAQVLSLVALAIFCVQIYGNRYEMNGRSMEPTIMDKAEFLVDKSIYQVKKPDRFDVVVYEGDFGGISIKRVLGLPGETIYIHDGIVEIDGKVLDYSEYVQEIKVSGVAATSHVIEEEEYFLIGDWPEASEDSRSSQIGDIHINQMKGRAWFCISPSEKLGFIKN